MKKYCIILFTIAITGVSCIKVAGNETFIADDSMPGVGAFNPSDTPGGGTTYEKRQEGDWTVYTLSEGLEYWNYEQFDMITKANQIVNVVSVDLNNPAYSVRFSCFPNASAITSSVFLGRQAVACINAAYERASVFIKVDGTVLANIASDVIPNTSVPQWKSECAIYTDGAQDVDIEFSAKNMTLQETRDLYSSSTKRNIISSAPMLIDNYDPVGTTFTTRMPSYYPGINITSLNYEDPVRHQGVRHPRTAVALTEDNHFLMVTVDGRWTGRSAGMNASELTRFLAEHFNPQYALNLDGGGSTTMCVEGFGDSRTHVVNYPTDNEVFDHAGERSVSSHIYVVRNNIQQQ